MTIVWIKLKNDHIKNDFGRYSFEKMYCVYIRIWFNHKKES